MYITGHYICLPCLASHTLQVSPQFVNSTAHHVTLNSPADSTATRHSTRNGKSTRTTAKGTKLHFPPRTRSKPVQLVPQKRAENVDISSGSCPDLDESDCECNFFCGKTFANYNHTRTDDLTSKTGKTSDYGTCRPGNITTSDVETSMTGKTCVDITRKTGKTSIDKGTVNPLTTEDSVALDQDILPEKQVPQEPSESQSCGDGDITELGLLMLSTSISTPLPLSTNRQSTTAASKTKLLQKQRKNQPCSSQHQSVTFDDATLFRPPDASTPLQAGSVRVQEKLEHASVCQARTDHCVSPTSDYLNRRALNGIDIHEGCNDDAVCAPASCEMTSQDHTCMCTEIEGLHHSDIIRKDLQINQDQSSQSNDSTRMMMSYMEHLSLSEIDVATCAVMTTPLHSRLCGSVSILSPAPVLAPETPVELWGDGGIRGRTSTAAAASVNGLPHVTIRSVQDSYRSL